MRISKQFVCTIRKVVYGLHTFSVFKSFYYSLKICGFRNGIRLPILIDNRSNIKMCKGSLIVVAVNAFGTVQIIKNTRIIMSPNSVLQINGRFVLRGTSILLQPGARMICGDNFSTNGNCVFNVAKRFIFGSNILFSANALVYDTDYHSIYSMDGELLNPNKEVIIGNDVWFGNRVTILKGTKIANNIIFGAGSVITGDYLLENAIYGGLPAKLLKRNIRWSYEPPIN